MRTKLHQCKYIFQRNRFYSQQHQQLLLQSMHRVASLQDHLDMLNGMAKRKQKTQQFNGINLQNNIYAAKEILQGN